MVKVSNCFHLNRFKLVFTRRRLGHPARHTSSTLPFGIRRVLKRLEIYWKDFERHSYVSRQHVDRSPHDVHELRLLMGTNLLTDFLLIQEKQGIVVVVQLPSYHFLFNPRGTRLQMLCKACFLSHGSR